MMSIKPLLLGALVIALFGSSAQAQNCASIPNTFINGQPASATTVNANFTYLGGCAASINNPNFTGNVGIGTTTPAYPLDVNGNVHIASGPLYFDGGYIEPLAVNTNIGMNASGTGNLYLNGTGTGNVYIGNGIGSVSFYGVLNLPNPSAISGTGNTYFQLNAYTSGDAATMYSLNGSNYGFSGWSRTYSGYFIGSNFTTGAAPWLLIKSGNVGIGNTSPAYLLHVGSSSASGAVAELQNSSGACTHTPTASSETVSCSSDARLKNHISDAAPALPWLGDMRIRDFSINATGEKKTGVIAQEMLAKHPDMVHVGSDGFFKVDEPSPWKLLEAIQELKAANDRLQSENASLKTRLSISVRRLDVIEAKLGIREAATRSLATHVRYTRNSK